MIGAANPAGNAPCFMFAGDRRRAARTNGKVVLFEGDGSLLMQIQELETDQAPSAQAVDLRAQRRRL
jgi:hypothetical protein